MRGWRWDGRRAAHNRAMPSSNRVLWFLVLGNKQLDRVRSPGVANGLIILEHRCWASSASRLLFILEIRVDNYAFAQQKRIDSDDELLFNRNMMFCRHSMWFTGQCVWMWNNYRDFFLFNYSRNGVRIILQDQRFHSLQWGQSCGWIVIYGPNGQKLEIGE